MIFKKEDITEDLNAILVCTKDIVIHSVVVKNTEQILVRKGEWFSCYHRKGRFTIWFGFKENSPSSDYEYLRYSYKNEKVHPTLLEKQLEPIE